MWDERGHTAQERNSLRCSDISRTRNSHRSEFLSCAVICEKEKPEEDKEKSSLEKPLRQGVAWNANPQAKGVNAAQTGVNPGGVNDFGRELFSLSSLVGITHSSGMHTLRAEGSL